jgi:hypothetical protein
MTEATKTKKGRRLSGVIKQDAADSGVANLIGTTHSLTHTHTHTPSLYIHSLTHSLTQPLNHSHLHSLTHPLTPPLTHSSTHTHSLTHSLTHRCKRSGGRFHEGGDCCLARTDRSTGTLHYCTTTTPLLHYYTTTVLSGTAMHCKAVS